MGRYVFRLPDIGEGVTEAEIVAWYVKPGETIQEDQGLLDIMTDKATVDISCPVGGVVTAVHGDVGSLVPVGSVLVELDVEGEGNVADDVRNGAAMKSQSDISAPELAPTPAPAPVAAPAPAVAQRPVDDGGQPSSLAFATRVAGDAPLAAPATRRRAHELGIPLQYVPASGPGGRVTPEDLDAFVASGGALTAADGRFAARQDIVETRIVGLRRKIAERMLEAKRRIPHITYVEEIDITELEALRQCLNEQRAPEQAKLTLLPFFIRALVRVLPDFRNLNARYDDEAGVLSTYAGVHIGIATQTPAGLMVPVIRHAETLDIWGLAAGIKRVSTAARDGSASREELSGSTITITSLGALGGITTTPIINHPEVAIIGPNKAVDRPTINGAFVTVRKMMNLSSSFDHRIVDGHEAARFTERMKRVIEHPALIFMD